MSTTQTPTWNAAQAGVLGQAGATAQSAQLNQLLGTHAEGLIYPGTPIVSPQLIDVVGSGPINGQWNGNLSTQDVDQPFVLGTGTAVSRVQVPLLAVGNGADALISLCADNGSGQPGTVITQTRLPASWIKQLSVISAASGPSSSAPVVSPTGNPLAVSQFVLIGWSTGFNTAYAYPAVNASGAAASPSASWYSPSSSGGWIIQVGGVSGGAALTSVFTFPYDGAGNVSASIPQPAFPTTNDGSSATCVVVDASTGTPVVVNTGGGTSFHGAPVASVYTSSLDSSGNLGGWSAQTALPAPVQSHSMCAYNGYVYSIGGLTTGGATNLNTVNYAQVQNGQITGWTAAMPLPVPLELAYVAVSNGYLYVISGTTFAVSSAFTAVYYAAINSNGSLGPWNQGPSLPVSGYNLNTNAFGNNEFIMCFSLVVGGSYTATAAYLPVTPSGPATNWLEYTVGPGLLGTIPGFVDLGNGSVRSYTFTNNETRYITISHQGMPYLSVPLPATSLTNGATYHVLLQQQGGDLNDYLLTCLTGTLNPATGPTALLSPRLAYTWTASPFLANYGVPITVSVNPTTRVPGQMPLHTWEDNGARVTTTVQATTPDQRLLGLCEATQMQLGINQNQGFETGITPWTVTGGTVTRSTAQAYSGLHSALVTPNGVATQAYISSENLPCLIGQSVTASCWIYAPLGITGGNFSLSINWYSNVGGYISTLTTPVSVPAATWTQVTVTATAPNFAYQWNINPVEGGTPTTSQVFYIDNILGYWTYAGAQQSTVTQYDYVPGTTWPLTGVTELA